MNSSCDGINCEPLQRILLEILDRLDQLSAKPTTDTTSKEFLTTEEFADRVGLRSDRTVRDYLKTGRLNGIKQKSGRGRSQRWVLPVEEVTRYHREGLLPGRNSVAA